MATLFWTWLSGRWKKWDEGLCTSTWRSRQTRSETSITAMFSMARSTFARRPKELSGTFSRNFWLTTLKVIPTFGSFVQQRPNFTTSTTFQPWLRLRCLRSWQNQLSENSCWSWRFNPKLPTTNQPRFCFQWVCTASLWKNEAIKKSIKNSKSFLMQRIQGHLWQFFWNLLLGWMILKSRGVVINIWTLSYLKQFFNLNCLFKIKLSPLLSSIFYPIRYSLKVLFNVTSSSDISSQKNVPKNLRHRGIAFIHSKFLIFVWNF